MKVKELLARREQLRGQKKGILKQIEEQTAKMNKVDLEEFIRSGDAGKVDGFELDKLQRKRKHLVLLGESLDQAIVEAQGKERERKIAKMLREADQLAYNRAKLSDKIRHFLIKVQSLQKEARGIKVEETTLRSLANTDSQPAKEIHFRLNGMEDFLEKQIILTAGEERIRKEVLAARKHNKEILSQPKIKANDKILRNVRIKWDCQTLALSEFEITEQSAEVLMRNLGRKGSLTKADFLKETC